MMSTSAPLLSGDPIAPVWLVAPVAVLALLAVAGHVLLIERADMPPVRKRIRTVNGLLMMLTIPLAAAAFAVVPPTRPRAFVMLWMLVVGLVVIILFLAMLDVVTTLVLHRAARAELRRQLHEARALAAHSGDSGA